MTDPKPRTDWRNMPVLVDGMPMRLASLARKLDCSCAAAKARYARRAKPVTLASLQQDGRSILSPVRVALADRTRKTEQRETLRQLLDGNVSQAECARLLGISRQRIHQLKKELGDVE